MDSVLLPISHWHWLIAGLLLMIVEVFAPGFVFFWLGLAAGTTGVALLLWPGLGWEYQFLMFAVFSVASIAVFRIVYRSRVAQTDQPSLNRRGEQYVGRRFTLNEAIVDGVGEMRVDDTIWRVHGTDLPAGSRVQVDAVDGNTLRVSPLPPQENGVRHDFP